MAGENAVLWKAVRKPIGRWRTRVGGWWLAGVFLVYVLEILRQQISFGASLSSPFTSSSVPWYSQIFLPVDVVVLAAWLHAASVVDRFAVEFFEEVAAPVPGSILRARYWLAFSQGVAPLTIFFVVSLLTRAPVAQPMVQLADAPSEIIAANAGLLAPAFQATALLALRGVWLMALLVLCPYKRWLAWLLMLAVTTKTLVAWQFASALSMRQYNLADPDLFEDSSEYFAAFDAFPLGWLAGAVVLLGLLMYLKCGKLKTAYWLYFPLLVATVMYPLLLGCYILKRGAIYSPLAHVSHYITSFFSWPPTQWNYLTKLVYESFPHQPYSYDIESLLVPAVVEPIWVILMVLLVQHVLLRKSD